MKLNALGLAAPIVALPALASAQDVAAAVPTDVVFILNSLLFLVGGFLVFWMACGFAMLEAGLVRSKNVTMQLTKNMGLFGLACIFYYLIGYNLMYPLGTWGIDGVLSGVWGTAVMEVVGVGAEGVDDYSYASTASDFFFQLMFCAATASIVSGALAERIKLWPFLIFVVILTSIIYPIQASWKWGGGFLEVRGFLDFAGSTVVHSVGGWAALTGALILGPRIGKYKDGKVHPILGSNLTLATLGTFCLWLGWFGFNGGSQLAMGSIGDVADVSRIFANTNAAAAGGLITAMILTQILYKKPDLTMILNGALAGQAENRRRCRCRPRPPVRRYLGYDRGCHHQPRRQPRYAALLDHRGRYLRCRHLCDCLVHSEGSHGHPGIRRRRDQRSGHGRARDGSLPRIHQRLSLRLFPGDATIPLLTGPVWPGFLLKVIETYPLSLIKLLHCKGTTPPPIPDLREV
jgi:Amt family ammonium transporter